MSTKFNSVVPERSLPNAIAHHQEQWGFWDGICHIDPEPPAADPTEPAPGPTQSDIDSLKEALRKERQERTNYERQLKAFEGVDPTLARKAQEIADKQAEWEAEQSRLRAQTEAEVKQQYEPKLQQQQQQLAQVQQRLLDYQRDTQLERAFLEAGGFSGEFEPAAIALRDRVRVNDVGQVEVLEEDGKTPAYVADKGQSRPKTMVELIKELQEKKTWFARHFKGSDTPGFNLNPGVIAGNPGYAGLNNWDKVAALRSQQGR